MNHETKIALLAEFERPKVVMFTPEEIALLKENYIEAVVSCALENAEPDEFGKVLTMEWVRGELTDQQFNYIVAGLEPEETARIEAKIARMRELGLSWKDL
ncbi:hypothetical protein [Paralysiella testudinis]|uniref:Uncharacterized protein n=1 Tax=Paralysiella testudinis TaxID=2809020 RepID=A0A892ZK50_9NEIS|nr:hypothetical protein [Paralysiella testudinis]QRQ83003.1 hypothetical protein JQU52_06440 [Paralysiella testudinis]